MQLELLVPLDTRELLVCPVSVVLLELLDLKERRYVLEQCSWHSIVNMLPNLYVSYSWLKHFSYTQGEQGYRGLEGNVGRDGARVSTPSTFISFHTKLHKCFVVVILWYFFLNLQGAPGPSGPPGPAGANGDKVKSILSTAMSDQCKELLRSL